MTWPIVNQGSFALVTGVASQAITLPWMPAAGNALVAVLAGDDSAQGVNWIQQGATNFNSANVDAFQGGTPSGTGSYAGQFYLASAATSAGLTVSWNFSPYLVNPALLSVYELQKLLAPPTGSNYLGYGVGYAGGSGLDMDIGFSPQASVASMYLGIIGFTAQNDNPMTVTGKNVTWTIDQQLTPGLVSGPPNAATFVARTHLADVTFDAGTSTGDFAIAPALWPIGSPPASAVNAVKLLNVPHYYCDNAGNEHSQIAYITGHWDGANFTPATGLLKEVDYQGSGTDTFAQLIGNAITAINTAEGLAIAGHNTGTERTAEQHFTSMTGAFNSDPYFPGSGPDRLIAGSILYH